MMTTLWDDLQQAYPIHIKAVALIVGLLLVWWPSLGLAWVEWAFLLAWKSVIALHVAGYVWRHRWTLLAEPLEGHSALLRRLRVRFDATRNRHGVALGFPVPPACPADARPTVLVTGGAMGLGRATALRLHALGHHVVVWDTNEGALAEVAAEAERLALPSQKAGEGPRARFVTHAVDVSSDQAVQAAAAGLAGLPGGDGRDGGGAIDVLVLNAGIVNGRAVVDTTAADVARLFGVNVAHLFHCCRHLLPGMIRDGCQERQKHVVVIGSVAGFAGAARVADYNGSKAAANLFAESLRMELRPHPHVNSSLVCPYVIDTGMFRGAIPLLLFPALRTEAVVDEIVGVIRYKKQLVVVPWFFQSLYFLKAVLPWFVLGLIDDVIGGTRMMRSFQGRTSVEEVTPSD